MDDFNRALALAGALMLTISVLLTGFLMVGTAAAQESFDDELVLEDGVSILVEATFDESIDDVNATAELDLVLTNENNTEVATYNDTLAGNASETVDWTFDLDASEYEELAGDENATATVTLTADEGVLAEYTIEIDDDAAGGAPITEDDNLVWYGLIAIVLIGGFLYMNSNGNGNGNSNHRRGGH